MPSFSNSTFSASLPGLERVGDVLEEEQAKDHVLVLGGVHRAAQLVCGGPESVFKSDARFLRFRFCHDYSSRNHPANRTFAFFALGQHMSALQLEYRPPNLR